MALGKGPTSGPRSPGCDVPSGVVVSSNRETRRLPPERWAGPTHNLRGLLELGDTARAVSGAARVEKLGRNRIRQSRRFTSSFHA